MVLPLFPSVGGVARSAGVVALKFPSVGGVARSAGVVALKFPSVGGVARSAGVVSLALDLFPFRASPSTLKKSPSHLFA